MGAATAAGGHEPVMLEAAMDGLAIEPAGWYVDATFGRGGHSRGILSRLGPEGRLLAVDRDRAAITSDAAGRLVQDPRFSIEYGRFGELRGIVERRGWMGRIAGVLLDLGVSSPQLDEPGRGFSFLKDGPLDMRMDNTQGMTAADWLDRVPEERLADTLRVYGEERYARRIARAIVARRSRQPIHTTRDLAEVIAQAVPSRERSKHPATRSFQAIRIAVNHELEELDAGLRQSVEVLAANGRLVVISFHSLEDRLVKRFLRDEERGHEGDPRFPPVSRRLPRLRRVGKAQRAGADEVARNPRARSAILRVAERLAP